MTGDNDSFFLCLKLQKKGLLLRLIFLLNKLITNENHAIYAHTHIKAAYISVIQVSVSVSMATGTANWRRANVTDVCHSFLLAFTASLLPR